MFELEPQHSFLSIWMCANIYDSGELAQVWSSGCREPGRQRIIGKKRISNRCEAWSGGGPCFLGIRGDRDLVVFDDLIGDLSSIRGTERGEIFDLIDDSEL